MEGEGHAGSACFGFADGHAAAFRLATVWHEGLSADSNCGGLQWNPESEEME